MRFLFILILSLFTSAFALELETDNRDAVKLHQNNAWNMKLYKEAATQVGIRQMDGTPISGSEPAYINIANSVYLASANKTLTIPDLSDTWSFSTDSGTLYLYAGAQTSSFAICASDAAGLQTKGSVAAGSYGRVECSGTVGNTASMRQIGYTVVASNVAGTPVGNFSNQIWGQVSDATTGSATLSFPVTGLTTANACMVTPVSLGTGPAYMVSAVTAADSIDVTFDAAQTAGSTKITFLCW
jgi:hypothetical protein